MTDGHRDALPVGSELEEYRIESILGRGGFGVTYLAFDQHLSRRVAIKEYLPAEVASRDQDATVRVSALVGPQTFQRGLDGFLREAQILAQFRHPCIVAVRRFFRSNGTGYLVMDYEEGESLAQFLRRSPAPNATLLRRWLDGLLDGLQGVHAAGVLHRDIKPSNIYLRRDGEPVLLDFGASRHVLSQQSRTITSIFTPGYAPLEQYDSGADQGPWTDIYAVGAVLYRAISGEPPPEAPGRVLVDRLVALVERGRGRYPHAFLAALDASLALEPRSRPQSVAEWRSMLADVVGEPTILIPTRSETRSERNLVPLPRARGAHSQRQLALGLTAAAVGVVVVLVLGTRFGGHPSIEPRVAVTPERPSPRSRELRERGAQEIARGDEFAAIESHMRAKEEALAARPANAIDPDSSADLTAAEHGLARLRNAMPSMRVPSLQADVIRVQLFEKGSGEYPAPGKGDYTDRFSAPDARFVCFEVECTHAAIRDRAETTFGAVLYKDGAAYGTSDRSRVSTDPGARTSWFQSCLGGKTPGRWTAGRYRFDIYFDGQKAVSREFMVTG